LFKWLSLDKQCLEVDDDDDQDSVTKTRKERTRREGEEAAAEKEGRQPVTQREASNESGIARQQDSKTARKQDKRIRSSE